MRHQLFRSNDVSAWPLTKDQAAMVTIYPFVGDRDDDYGGQLSIQWNLTPKHARQLAADLLKACEAIDAQTNALLTTEAP